MNERVTYRHLMYIWAHALEDLVISLEGYYMRLEEFVIKHRLRQEDSPVMMDAFPHMLLKNLSDLRGMFMWANVIMLLPKCVVCALVRKGFVPPPAEIIERCHWLVELACQNPDQTASVVQYLVEADVLPFNPRFSYLEFARTECTVRFLLAHGCMCPGLWIDKQLEQFYDEPGVKASIMDLLFKHGGYVVLRKWAWIDLATWRVLEKYVERNVLLKWMGCSKEGLIRDLKHDYELWPHLITNYGLRFTDAEYADAFNCNSWILTRNHIQAEPQKTLFVYRRLATLLNHHPTPPPFALPTDLLELDRLLNWGPRTARYYSAQLRSRLFTLLCVVHRLMGSTLWFKPLLPPLVASMAQSPVEREITPHMWMREGNWCVVQ